MFYILCGVAVSLPGDLECVNTKPLLRQQQMYKEVEPSAAACCCLSALQSPLRFPRHIYGRVSCNWTARAEWSAEKESVASTCCLLVCLPLFEECKIPLSSLSQTFSLTQICAKWSKQVIKVVLRIWVEERGRRGLTGWCREAKNWWYIYEMAGQRQNHSTNNWYNLKISS